MNNRFTPENSVVLMVDCQKGCLHLARNRSHCEILGNTRALARAAVETEMPLILTSCMEGQFLGYLVDDLADIAPEEYWTRIRRCGPSFWQHECLQARILATGRRKLILAGFSHDLSLVFLALAAAGDGFEVQVVADAGGSPNQTAENAAFRRMESHGVTVTTTGQLLAELAWSWTEGQGPKLMKILTEEIVHQLVVK